MKLVPLDGEKLVKFLVRELFAKGVPQNAAGSWTLPASTGESGSEEIDGPLEGTASMHGAQDMTGSWSIASPSEIERTARDLMRLRARFLEAGNGDSFFGRPIIRRSWERCRALHVDAARRNAPLAVTRDAQLREIQDENEPLLRAASAVVERLADHLTESGYAVVLTDAKGCILRIAGDAGVRRRLERIDFVPGGDWSEAAAGTNAIGTALADRRAVQLLASEHFCDGWTDLTCTAVPVRDPRSGGVVGVLDITGDYRLIRAHLTSLLSISVLEIEERLRVLTGTEQRACAGAGRDSNQSPAGGMRDGDAPLLMLSSGAVSASLDVNSTLRSVAERAAALLHVEQTVVGLFADPRDEQRFAIRWSSHSAAGVTSPLDTLLRRCDAVPLLRERGEPIIADDIAELAIFGQPGAASPLRSVVLLPLPTARGIIGFVAAGRAAVSRWNFADLERAFALMAVAATAIENAFLFQSLRHRNHHVEAINAVARLLGEMLEPADHLARILAAIVEVMDCQGGALFLRDPGGAQIVAATYGEPQGADAALAARVATCGRTLCSLDPARSVLAVPLIEGIVVGVLQLSRKDGSLDTPDIETVEAIVQQLGLSLKNARLLRAAGEVEVLRRADRLKSDFLAMVSHDLRSPLTAIRASVDGLFDRPARVAVPIDDGFLRTISAQAHRLGRLVDQLLDVSQIEAGALRLDREWHELPALLSDAVESISALYGAQPILCEVAPNPPLLFVDHDRFIQVLYNLLDNARKHAPCESVVTIEARWTSAEIVIGVADCGPGVRASEREEIFKRFYGSGLKTATRSIGLGLAICRGIAEAHAGSIWVEERCPGPGSVFRFRIPLVADLALDSGR